MKLTRLTQAQLTRAAAIYHPGSGYEVIGSTEAQCLTGGGLGVRYHQSKDNVFGGGASTVADYTVKEAKVIIG